MISFLENDVFSAEKSSPSRLVSLRKSPEKRLLVIGVGGAFYEAIITSFMCISGNSFVDGRGDLCYTIGILIYIHNSSRYGKKDFSSSRQ